MFLANTVSISLLDPSTNLLYDLNCPNTIISFPILKSILLINLSDTVIFSKSTESLNLVTSIKNV